MANGFLSLCLLLHVVVPFTAASPALLGTQGLIFAIGFDNVYPSDVAARSGGCSLQLGYGQMALSDRPCVYGLCALLNETSISCARPVNFMSNSAYTVAAWLSPFVNQFFPGTLTFFNAFSSDTNAALQFGIQSFTGMYPNTFANVPRLYVNDDFQYYLNGSSFQFPFVWNPTEWTHVAFVFDGAYVRLYINATLQSAFIGPTDMSITSNSYSFNVGSPSRQTYGLIPYQGLIDELGVFNIALNQSQINDLFTVAGTSASTSTPSTAQPTTTPAPSTAAPTTASPTRQPTYAVSTALNTMPGCIGAFGFDTTAPLDSTGLASSCTITIGLGQTNLSSSQCIYGTCMLLNESQISCVEPTSGWPTTASAEYTVAAWIAPFLAPATSGTHMFFNVLDAGGNSVQFGITSYGMVFPSASYNTPQLYSNSQGLSYANGTAYGFPFQTTGAWTHIALVSTGGFVRVYINATLQSAFIEGAIQPVRQTPFTFNIGSKIGSNWGMLAFQGRIDELGVFNIALSQSQIADLYGVASLTSSPTTSVPSNAPTTAPSVIPSTSQPTETSAPTAPTTTVPTTAVPTTSRAPTTTGPTISPTSHAPSEAPTAAPTSGDAAFSFSNPIVMGVTLGLSLILLVVAIVCVVRWGPHCNCCCVHNYSPLPTTSNVPLTTTK